MFLAAALGGVALQPGRAFAQQHSASDVEGAREAFREGKRLEEAGDLQGALEKLKAAHALGRTPVTGIELAHVYAKLNMPVEGREVCLDIERTPVAPQETQKSQDARRESATLSEELKAKIASLTVRVTGAPPGTDPSITIDGTEVPTAALSEPRKLNPGAHTVLAHVSTGPVTKTDVTLKEGESQQIDVTVVPPAAPPPLPKPVTTATSQTPLLPPQQQPPEKKTSPLVPIGIGIAGVGAAVGLVSGILAIADKPGDSDCPGNHCPPGHVQDNLHTAQTAGNVATVAWIVAGVGAGVAITGWVIGGSSAKAQVTTGSASGAGNGNGASDASDRSSRAERSSSTPTTIIPYIGWGALGVHGSF